MLCELWVSLSGITALIMPKRLQKITKSKPAIWLVSKEDDADGVTDWVSDDRVGLIIVLVFCVLRWIGSAREIAVRVWVGSMNSVAAKVLFWTFWPFRSIGVLAISDVLMSKLASVIRLFRINSVSMWALSNVCQWCLVYLTRYISAGIIGTTIW